MVSIIWVYRLKECSVIDRTNSLRLQVTIRIRSCFQHKQVGKTWWHNGSYSTILHHDWIKLIAVCSTNLNFWITINPWTGFTLNPS